MAMVEFRWPAHNKQGDCGVFQKIIGVTNRWKRVLPKQKELFTNSLEVICFEGDYSGVIVRTKRWQRVVSMGQRIFFPHLRTDLSTLCVKLGPPKPPAYIKKRISKKEAAKMMAAVIKKQLEELEERDYDYWVFENEFRDALSAYETGYYMAENPEKAES